MITFNDYFSCVFEGKDKSVEHTRFETDKYVMRTVTRIKITLGSTDDKRLVLEDKVSTAAQGHHRLLKS